MGLRPDRRSGWRREEASAGASEARPGRWPDAAAGGADRVPPDEGRARGGDGGRTRRSPREADQAADEPVGNLYVRAEYLIDPVAPEMSTRAPAFLSRPTAA
ncbi:MAG TPA: hypothetical protein VKG87_06460, partial [Terriglobales bacterium]|nr:hypothetical protein [Terriglobales bacterium]